MQVLPARLVLALPGQALAELQAVVAGVLALVAETNDMRFAVFSSHLQQREGE